MAVLFIFVDGIGIGPSSGANPLATANFSGLEILSGGKKWTTGNVEVSEDSILFKPIDACLEVEGLPQSGTGQVALFTGVNASALIGKHYGPYPHSETKTVLAEKSFFKELLNAGKKPYFINAYPQRFFEYGEKTNRWSTSSLMVRQCGVNLNTIEEVIDGKALTAELFQDFWVQQLHLPVPNINAEIAAQRLNNALDRHDLVFLEYYLTDKAGHEQNQTFAREVLARIDAVIAAWINIKRNEDLLVLTSDHGNVEDLSVKTHTKNPVPLAVFGKAKSPLFEGITSLTGVKNALVDEVLKS